MKRIARIFLIAILLLSMALCATSCDKKNKDKGTTQATTAPQTPTGPSPALVSSIRCTSIVYAHPGEEPVTKTVPVRNSVAIPYAKNMTVRLVIAVVPDNAANPYVNYSLDSTACANINSAGVLTFTSAGTVTVTVSATDGSGVSYNLTIVAQ